MKRRTEEEERKKKTQCSFRTCYLLMLLPWRRSDAAFPVLKAMRNGKKKNCSFFHFCIFMVWVLISVVRETDCVRVCFGLHTWVCWQQPAETQFFCSVSWRTTNSTGEKSVKGRRTLKRLGKGEAANTTALRTCLLLMNIYISSNTKKKKENVTEINIRSGKENEKIK